MPPTTSQVHAELSALATGLDELSGRVTSIADQHAGTDDEELAGELYEIERSLVQAHRRLSRLLRARR